MTHILRYTQYLCFSLNIRFCDPFGGKSLTKKKMAVLLVVRFGCKYYKDGKFCKPLRSSRKIESFKTFAATAARLVSSLDVQIVITWLFCYTASSSNDSLCYTLHI